MNLYPPASRTCRAPSSSAVVMMMWPAPPIPPPPIARRSIPRAASVSARTASEPGSFFSSTTNWLAIGTSARLGWRDRAALVTGCPPILARRRSVRQPAAGEAGTRGRPDRSASPQRDGSFVQRGVAWRRLAIPVEVDRHAARDQVVPRRADPSPHRDRRLAGGRERVGSGVVER